MTGGQMVYQLLAEFVLLIHFLFVLFVIFGGLLALRWQWMPWLHLPAAAWGAGIELLGWICPLTPLENALRRAGNANGYSEGFIEHYLLPILYPAELTREIQFLLACLVILINLAVYIYVYRCKTKAKTPYP
jgi:hypothetical protein